MELSVTLFGVPISARTVSNFAVAGAINTALTPIELPLALALLRPRFSPPAHNLENMWCFFLFYYRILSCSQTRELL